VDYRSTSDVRPVARRSRSFHPEVAVTRPTAPAAAELRGGTVRRELDHAERVRTFEAEVLPHLDRLYSAALRYVRRPADADDLVQEALTTAFRAYHQVAEGSNVRAWLYRVLHTTFLSQYRRDGRRPTEDPTEDMEGAARDEVAGGPNTATAPSAEQVALSAFGPVEVREALAVLPEEQRVAVYLADVEGFAYREIAEIMDSPVGTVMSRLHRGRNALRASLADYAQRSGIVADDEIDGEVDA
jgi:RNA polymerase sigma-70 factor (ECF subfamily)